MAEVTGDLGGQPIQLNNAATEATLKQLLAAMTVMVNNTGKDKAARDLTVNKQTRAIQTMQTKEARSIKTNLSSSPKFIS